MWERSYIPNYRNRRAVFSWPSYNAFDLSQLTSIITQCLHPELPLEFDLCYLYVINLFVFSLVSSFKRCEVGYVFMPNLPLSKLRNIFMDENVNMLLKYEIPS